MHLTKKEPQQLNSVVSCGGGGSICKNMTIDDIFKGGVYFKKITILKHGFVQITSFQGEKFKVQLKQQVFRNRQSYNEPTTHPLNRLFFNVCQ